MIQRIQTVYLLLVAILMVVMMSFPVGSFVSADYSIPATEFTNLAVVSADGVSDYAPWALFAVLTVAAVISLVTIFLYRKAERRLQVYSVVDCLPAADFNHTELAGNPCHRQG